MSIPEKDVNKIRIGAIAGFEKKLKEGEKLLESKRLELEEVSDKRLRVDEKWVTDKINQDTCERLYKNYNGRKITLKGEIDRLTGDEANAFQIIKSKVELLSDLKFVYSKAGTIKKQELIRMEFDGNLYYQNNTYRTPAILNFIANNVNK